MIFELLPSYGRTTRCNFCQGHTVVREMVDGHCPDCNRLLQNIPEKLLTLKEFMETK